MIETNLKNRIEKIITPQEYSRILTAIKSNNDPDFESAVVLIYELGLRTRELLNLRWHDINTEKNTIVVRFDIIIDVTLGAVEQTKILPLPERSKSSLALLKESRGARPAEPVFMTPQGRQMTSNQFVQKLKFYLKQAAIMPDKIAVSPHIFRRTCAVRLSEEFAVNLVAQMLGHRKTQTTNNFGINSDGKARYHRRKLSKRQRTTQKNGDEGLKEV